MSEDFEGPEKNLLLYFDSSSEESDLRNIERCEWDKILLDAKCSILTKASSESTDSYVLSESSLFVRKRCVILKTCGTTSLLSCIDKLLEVAGRLQLSLKTILFIRSNYEFPDDQEYPHQNFSQEKMFISHLSSKLGLSLDSVKLGESETNSLYCILAHHPDEELSVENRCYILSYGLDLEVCNLFFAKSDRVKQRKSLIERQIGSISKIASMDEFLFQPCGYSLNALYEDGLGTIHITPEHNCSYASFESDVPLDKASLQQIIDMVVKDYGAKRYKVVYISCVDDNMFNLPIEGSVTSSVLNVAGSKIWLYFGSSIKPDEVA